MRSKTVNKGKLNMEAMSELVEEARFNKAAIVSDTSAAAELAALLRVQPSARRAIQLR
jgi:hypothetical protein